MPIQIYSGGTNIGEVTIAHNLEANILNVHGNIDSITIGDDIVGQELPLDPLCIFAEGRLDTLTCGGNVSRAEIGFLPGVPVGQITEEIGIVEISGSWSDGTGLVADSLTGGVIIGGDCSANFFLGDLGTPLTATDTRIRVGGAFTQGLTVYDTIPAQIQITLNNSAGSGTWYTGEVNGLVLQGPEYDQVPSQIGGGAIGLAPYFIHGTASVVRLYLQGQMQPKHTLSEPASNQVIVIADPDELGLEADIIWYGFIAPPPDPFGTPPTSDGGMLIQYRLAGCTEGEWTHITSTLAPYNGRALRQITMRGSSTGGPTATYPFERGYAYRITPNRNEQDPARVRCWLNEGGFTPLVAEDAIVWCVSCGDSDLDNNCTTDTTDLNIVLSDFGCTEGVGKCPGDVDGDGDTDTTDLNFVLIAFGCGLPAEECDGEGESMMMGGGGGGDEEAGGGELPQVLSVLGWTSNGEFLGWLDAQPHSDQLEYIQTILAIIPAFIEMEEEEY